MNFLSAIYGSVVGARNALYDGHILRSRRLQGPVISVGNLSAGGTGKTPFVILLGELLKARGIQFDVLSRGYGRRSKGVRLVDPAGLPAEFGDEPLLIARKLQVPVIVGESRFDAGRFAESKFGPQLHLLDDGFQHRRLARDFDIVMVSADDPQGTLLPIGRLREPVLSLKRAEAVVLTNQASCEGLLISPYLVWRVQRSLVLERDVPGPCFAFCGIARPQNFFEQLKAAGVSLSGTKGYTDHHAYTDSDVRRLLRLRARRAAKAFVTTEKDAINLQGRTEALNPLHVIPVQMRLENADAAVNALLAAIAARHRRSA